MYKLYPPTTKNYFISIFLSVINIIISRLTFERIKASWIFYSLVLKTSLHCFLSPIFFDVVTMAAFFLQWCRSLILILCCRCSCPSGVLKLIDIWILVNSISFPHSLTFEVYSTVKLQSTTFSIFSSSGKALIHLKSFSWSFQDFQQTTSQHLFILGLWCRKFVY